MVGKFKEKEKARKSSSFSLMFLGKKNLSFLCNMPLNIDYYYFFPSKEPNIVNIFP